MRDHREHRDHRLERLSGPSVRSWKAADQPGSEQMASNLALDCGWGRLIFGQTFETPQALAKSLLQESPGRRDIGFYIRDPHVVLSLAPDRLFLDPSHAYRLWLDRYRPAKTPKAGFVIRRAASNGDFEELQRIYALRHMVHPSLEFLREHRRSRTLTYFVAEDESEHGILGAIMGVDHVQAFNDPENGSSFWCLAVDPLCARPGVGEGLVRFVIEHYLARGRSFVDLSVMHDNEEAIALYEKMGFERAPVFTVKRKNPINEPLFIAPDVTPDLNPYARLIVDEARRRGITVEILDEPTGHFALSWGGRRVACWESLSELTTSLAMVRCDDKALTRRILKRAGLRVPDQRPAGDLDRNEAFLALHGRVVVKPKRGEQGAGIAVDVRSPEELAEAVAAAGAVCDEVLLEEMVEGEDLRIIVIGEEVVAAAVRRPPTITGTGRHTCRELVEKLSRRRAAVTGGESRVPLDEETLRCLRCSDLGWEDVPPEGETVMVRKAANLHTGGSIHDVTERMHPALAEAAVRGARALEIPVVGFDFLVPSEHGDDYVFIEANERPGLANHEPQPTAERYIDLLFPQTAAGPAGLG